MKIAIITDSHAGVRNDNPIYFPYMKKMYDEVFFPYIQANNIKNVFHLGDIVDKRKNISFLTLNKLKSDLLDPLEQMGSQVYALAGNHDVYYKDTNSINAFNELLGHRENVKIFTNLAEIVRIDDLDILMLPWLCSSNRDENVRIIQDTPAHVLFGHLELKGFEMYKGLIASHGDDPGLFEKFDVVASGHYHHKSTDGNINYLGAPFEFYWSDYADPRGFHVFDTQTRELEFIRNPNTLHEKIYYDDENEKVEDVLENDYSVLSGKIIKVVVKSKTNAFWFDTFMDRIEKAAPHDVTVVDAHMHMDDLSSDSIISDDDADTVQIIRSSVHSLVDENVDKARLEKLMLQLYNESLMAD